MTGPFGSGNFDYRFDIVIPLYCQRWNTRAVLEGLTRHYQPRALHVIAPETEVRSLLSRAGGWAIAPLHAHPEEEFFVAAAGLTKAAICAEIDLGASLYTPGWFYQQLLKLGAPLGIPELSEWYVVWDSDLLPVATWPLLNEGTPMFALLQHNQYGNPQIVAMWAAWIRAVLGVEPSTDPVGTFVPHHMWLRRSHLDAFARQVAQYYQSENSWLLLMMRSAREFGTFSEYWAYVSWVAATAPEDLNFYPYEQYGETTERFFDDGTALFSKALQEFLGATQPVSEAAPPAYAEIEAFVRALYPPDPLPSSLSFESSPRHLHKDAATTHIEERRSRWNPRNAT